MRAVVFHGPRDVRVEQVPDSEIVDPTDVVARITLSCVCGSDLHPYRGHQPWDTPGRCGHEWLGVVEDVGAEVSNFSPGDLVLSPFTVSDGTCEFCRRGLHSACRHGAMYGMSGLDGGQAEAIRVPYADGTLVRLPAEIKGDARMLRKIVPLSDVMATGHHAARCAGVHEGATVGIVGDGPTGLCGILAARRLGAERIIAIGHHNNDNGGGGVRLALAERLGATDVIVDAGEDTAATVQQMTGGGVDCALECVGGTSDASIDLALNITRPGGQVGTTGMPFNDGKLDRWRMTLGNIGLRGGSTPVRAYQDELLADVLAGRLDPSPVLDHHIGLDDAPEGYRAMDERTVTKVLIGL